ncbi:MAG: DNA polymerase I, partial [bacterium]
SLLRSSSRILEWIERTVSSSQVVKVGEDIKAVIRYLSTLGVRMAGPLFDTSVASYLLDPGRRDHSLTFLVEREFGFSLTEFKKEPKGEKNIPPDLFDKEVAAPACSRADAALRMHEPLEQKLREDGLLDLYSKVESPLTAVLADMEEAGVLIDVDFFNEMSQTLARDLSRIEKEIYDLAGEHFNINSSRQLAAILFEKLGLPYGRKTKTGYSTSQDLLEKLSLEHELPGRVLEYREIYKLKSTYVDTLPGLVSKKTGRIHTTFNQAVAATGRLSSSDPNLQNIPMRTELGREIRKGFLAGEGNVLLSLDYSQVELRILAHLTGEERLKKAYKAGKDIHRETAALVFGVRPEEVTTEMRNTAKMVNYGLVYGMSPYGLSQRLDISAEEAREFVNAYFDSLPRVKKWIDSTLDSVREKGYTTTLLGRRRYFRDIRSSDHNQRELAERGAVNSPIQGSAADMIKVAMVAIHRELPGMNTRARMIIQIHDELLFEVPDEDLEDVSSMAREKMTSAIQLDVPLEVEIGRGRTWYDAHHQ